MSKATSNRLYLIIGLCTAFVLFGIGQNQINTAVYASSDDTVLTLSSSTDSVEFTLEQLKRIAIPLLYQLL